MTTARLEAFSDAVIAIIMTIMVLELTPPMDEAGWNALTEMRSEFLTFALSFVFLGIYWSNHHHLIQATKRVNGRILWANIHLLFWLSLTPFVTGWMGNEFASAPVAAYGIVLLLSAIAYYILQGQILSAHGPDSALKAALGKDRKGKASPLLYSVAIAFAFVSRWVSVGLYVFVALMWLVPDRRIESLYDDAEREDSER
ncbi:MAG: TMEM175 family protein [Actinomycetota bacterium]